MQKYKKIIFEMDDKNNHRFLISEISKEELDKINNGYLLEDGKLKGDVVIKNGLKIIKNPEYIKINDVSCTLKLGSVNKWSKIIYFKYEENEQLKAGRKIINSFFNLIGGRNIKSLQNLPYITKENLEFAKKMKQEYFKSAIDEKTSIAKETKKGKTEK